MGDKYFTNEEGVVATYEIDYDEAYKFEYELGKNNTMMVLGMIPYCWPCLPFGCCFVNSGIFKDNIKDTIRAQHVAITRDGIKYVVERHKTLCRLDCQDQGKVSKTVPFDKIADCDVEEPAGASGPCCYMVQNTLTLVNVDAASGNRGTPGQPGRGRELTLKGLKDPNGFKRLSGQ